MKEGAGEEKCDVISTRLGGRTIAGHSGRVSTMGKPRGDELRHRTAISWSSILRVSTAIARAEMIFPGGASWPDAGHPVNKRTLRQEVNRWG